MAQKPMLRVEVGARALRNPVGRAADMIFVFGMLKTVPRGLLRVWSRQKFLDLDTDLHTLATLSKEQLGLRAEEIASARAQTTAEKSQYHGLVGSSAQLLDFSLEEKMPNGALYRRRLFGVDAK